MPVERAFLVLDNWGFLKTHPPLNPAAPPYIAAAAAEARALSSPIPGKTTGGGMPAVVGVALVASWLGARNELIAAVAAAAATAAAGGDGRWWSHRSVRCIAQFGCTNGSHG